MQQREAKSTPHRSGRGKKPEAAELQQQAERAATGNLSRGRLQDKAKQDEVKTPAGSRVPKHQQSRRKRQKEK